MWEIAVESTVAASPCKKNMQVSMIVKLYCVLYFAQIHSHGMYFSNCRGIWKLLSRYQPYVSVTCANRRSYPWQSYCLHLQMHTSDISLSLPLFLFLCFLQGIRLLLFTGNIYFTRPRGSSTFTTLSLDWLWQLLILVRLGWIIDGRTRCSKKEK